jgi:hypothetical protein
MVAPRVDTAAGSLVNVSEYGTALYGAAAPAVSETYADRVRLRPDPAVWADQPGSGA